MSRADGEQEFVISPRLEEKLHRTKPPFTYTKGSFVDCSVDIVYRGIRHDRNEAIAVKHINLAPVSKSKERTWIEDTERRVDLFLEIVVLRHKNIVDHLGLELNYSDPINPRFILLMEFCSGGNLFTKSNSIGGLSVAQTKLYARQIADALLYLFHKGICHLDLKGANVVLTADDTPKICDFDDMFHLKCAARTGTSEVRVNKFTIRYTAPEMINSAINDKLDRPGRATDVYSFGCVLLEMLTGKEPQFKNPTGQRLEFELAIMFFIGNGGAPEVEPVKDISMEMYKLILLCIRPRPKDRITVLELAHHPSLTIDNDVQGNHLLEHLSSTQIAIAQDMVELMESRAKFCPPPPPLQDVSNDRNPEIEWPVVRNHPVRAELFDKLNRCKPRFAYQFEKVPMAIRNSAVYRGQSDSGTLAIKKMTLHSLSHWPSPTPEDMLIDLEIAVDHFLLTRTLLHANVVTHLAMELDNSIDQNPDVLIIMEFYPGGTLLDRNRRGPQLDVCQIKQYARQISSGIAYLHENGICHLDIKGGNIVLAQDGTLKICHLERIVKLRSASHTGLNEVYREMGTIPYMAPEMINPDHAQPGRASDIYSFGCVLIEMMTGDLPRFKTRAGKYLTTYLQIGTFVGGNYGGPEVPDTPLDLSLLVRQCIMRDPRERLTAKQVVRHPFLQPAWDGLLNAIDSVIRDDEDAAVRLISIKLEAGTALNVFTENLGVLMAVAHPNVVQLFGAEITTLHHLIIGVEEPLCLLYADLMSHFTVSGVMHSEMCNDGLFHTSRSLEECQKSLKTVFEKLKNWTRADRQSVKAPPTVSETTLLRIAYQICSALQFLERNDVFNNELTIQSIGVSRTFVPKLMDHEYFHRSSANHSPLDVAARAYGDFLVELLRLGDVADYRSYIGDNSCDLNILSRTAFLDGLHRKCVDEYRFPDQIARMVRCCVGGYGPKGSLFFGNLTEMWSNVRLEDNQIYLCKDFFSGPQRE